MFAQVEKCIAFFDFVKFIAGVVLFAENLFISGWGACRLSNALFVAVHEHKNDSNSREQNQGNNYFFGKTINIGVGSGLCF